MLILNRTLGFWNSSPKYPIKAILVPNLRIFIFGRNFVFGKIWGCWCKTPQWLLRVPTQKYPNKTISVLHLRVFFPRNITFWQIEGAGVKHDNSFLNSKIRYFQCKSSFYLHEALYELKFTSLKTKLLPNISKLSLQSYFLFPVLKRKTIFFKKRRCKFFAFTTCFHKDFCI